MFRAKASVSLVKDFRNFQKEQMPVPPDDNALLNLFVASIWIVPVVVWLFERRVMQRLFKCYRELFGRISRFDRFAWAAILTVAMVYGGTKPPASPSPNLLGSPPSAYDSMMFGIVSGERTNTLTITAFDVDAAADEVGFQILWDEEAVTAAHSRYVDLL